MSDLIDRQAVIRLVHSVLYEMMVDAAATDIEKPMSKEDKLLLKVNQIVCTRLKNMPSAEPDIDGYSSKLWKAAYERGKRDATPVTCRECKHYYIFPNGTNGMCKKSNDAWTSFYPWDFCSHGERREDAD